MTIRELYQITYRDTEGFGTWIFALMKAESQAIVAEVLTENSVHDTEPVPAMLAQQRNQIGKFYGDGIYDTQKTYGELSKRKITPIIPPDKAAIIHQHGNCKSPKLPCDQAVRGIRKLGRQGWKQNAGIIVRVWWRPQCFG